MIVIRTVGGDEVPDDVLSSKPFAKISTRVYKQLRHSIT